MTLSTKKRHNKWELKKSVFRKIRISPKWVREILQEFGFKVETYNIHNGITCIIAHKGHGKK